MGRLFAFITQLRNLTGHQVRFRVPNWFHMVRDLPSERTRNIKLHRIVRYCREYGPDWTIGILMDGEYTGIEIRSSDLLEYARLVFRYVGNETGHDVLCVEGVKENQTSDYLLRLRYFGFMRNMFWDTRPSVEIHRADSRVAAKLRDIEAPLAQHSPFRPILQRQTASPMRESEKHVEKSIYEVKENRHHVYSSTADKKALTPHMSAALSRMPPHDSDTYRQNSPEKMPNSNAMMESTNDNKKSSKPNVNTSVQPEERVPESPYRGINAGNIDKMPIMTDVQNYMYGFVHGVLFMIAFMFVLFVHILIRRCVDALFP